MVNKYRSLPILTSLAQNLWKIAILQCLVSGVVKLSQPVLPPLPLPCCLLPIWIKILSKILGLRFGGSNCCSKFLARDYCLFEIQFFKNFQIIKQQKLRASFIVQNFFKPVLSKRPLQVFSHIFSTFSSSSNFFPSLSFTDL